MAADASRCVRVQGATCGQHLPARLGSLGAAAGAAAARVPHAAAAVTEAFTAWAWCREARRAGSDAKLSGLVAGQRQPPQPRSPRQPFSADPSPSLRELAHLAAKCLRPAILHQTASLWEVGGGAHPTQQVNPEAASM